MEGPFLPEASIRTSNAGARNAARAPLSWPLGSIVAVDSDGFRAGLMVEQAAGSAGTGGDVPEAGLRLATFVDPGLLFDVVVPIVAYQVMIHVFGVARLPALVLSGAFPALHVARRLVRAHRIDPIGLIVVLGIGVGAVVSYVSGSEKLTLLRESFFTAAIGLGFLASIVVGKPLMFLIVRRFAARDDEEALARWDQQWQEVAGLRKVMRQMTAVWGVALLGEFVLKVAMVETLSTDTVQAVSGPLILAITVSLIVVTFRWGQRARARGEAAAAGADSS
jgi:hypothetical protein